jgi:ABC-type nitrate/sulfonate/bicarbonate transport system substrate-binding protein
MKSDGTWLAVILLNLVLLCARLPSTFAAEKLVGLQSAPSMAMALPWIAEEARLYSKYGLDFHLVYIASSGMVTMAMTGGNGEVAIVGGEGPIRAFLGGNTDFVFIGSVKNVLTHSIMGKPEIKKPEDLKGKKIGVGRIGGNSHYFVQYALRQKGLDPSRDVNPIQTGGAPETFLALSSGAVDAAALTTPQDTRAAFLGYNYVIDGREIRPPYVATGFVTLRSVIAKRPRVVSQFMRMMAESNKLLVTDRELTFKVMAKKLRLNDRRVFDAAYTGELKVIEPKLDIRPEAIQATLQEISKTDPRAMKVSAQQLIDRRFLEEMEKDGTFERLGMK